jgi:hypothetical protein
VQKQKKGILNYKKSPHPGWEKGLKKSPIVD